MQVDTKVVACVWETLHLLCYSLAVFRFKGCQGIGALSAHSWGLVVLAG